MEKPANKTEHSTHETYKWSGAQTSIYVFILLHSGRLVNLELFRPVIIIKGVLFVNITFEQRKQRGNSAWAFKQLGFPRKQELEETSRRVRVYKPSFLDLVIRRARLKLHS